MTNTAPFSRPAPSPRLSGLAKRAVGQAGEELAARWYLEHGYEVVERNWRCRFGELDIVARKGSLTVFCEVKARNGTAFGHPAEAVGWPPPGSPADRRSPGTATVARCDSMSPAS